MILEPIRREQVQSASYRPHEQRTECEDDLSIRSHLKQAARACMPALGVRYDESNRDVPGPFACVACQEAQRVNGRAVYGISQTSTACSTGPARRTAMHCGKKGRAVGTVGIPDTIYLFRHIPCFGTLFASSRA
jgi:hypothetical protein